MNLVPRNATLAEALYREIDKNDYLQEIYGDLLYNYSIKLFHTDRRPRNIPINDALRFADLLAKSSYTPTADRDHLWGQEIAILMRLLYPKNEVVKYYLGSVLSAVGNYRGLMSKTIEGFHSEDFLDSIFYGYDKQEHLIPGKEEEYFFNDQMKVYYGMKEKFYSYVKRARKFCRFALDIGAIPLAPHLLYPQFMDDENPEERYLATHTINY